MTDDTYAYNGELCHCEDERDESAEESIDEYELRLQHADQTINNRNVLIGLLRNQLQKIEQLYKKNLDESQEIRFKYFTVVQELEQLKTQDATRGYEDAPTACCDYKLEDKLENIEMIIGTHTNLLQQIADRILVDNFQSPVPEMIENQESVANDMEERVKSLEENVDTLSQDTECCIEAIENITKRNIQTNQSVAQCQRQIEAIVSENGETTSQTDQLTENTREINTKIEQVNSSIGDLSKQTDNVNEAILKLNDKTANLEDLVGDLQKTDANLENRIDKLEKELDLMRSTVEKPDLLHQNSIGDSLIGGKPSATEEPNRTAKRCLDAEICKKKSCHGRRESVQSSDEETAVDKGEEDEHASDSNSEFIMATTLREEPNSLHGGCCAKPTCPMKPARESQPPSDQEQKIDQKEEQPASDNANTSTEAKANEKSCPDSEICQNKSCPNKTLTESSSPSSGQESTTMDEADDESESDSQSGYATALDISVEPETTLANATSNVEPCTKSSCASKRAKPNSKASVIEDTPPEGVKDDMKKDVAPKDSQKPSKICTKTENCHKQSCPKVPKENVEPSVRKADPVPKTTIEPQALEAPEHVEAIKPENVEEIKSEKGRPSDSSSPVNLKLINNPLVAAAVAQQAATPKQPAFACCHRNDSVPSEQHVARSISVYEHEIEDVSQSVDVSLVNIQPNRSRRPQEQNNKSGKQDAPQPSSAHPCLCATKTRNGKPTNNNDSFNQTSSASYSELFECVKRFNLKLMKIEHEKYLEVLQQVQNEVEIQKTKPNGSQEVLENYLSDLQEQLDVTKKIEDEIDKLRMNIAEQHQDFLRYT